MPRKKGETPEEEFEETARRFIEDEEDLSYTATNTDWFEFLEDKLGYDLSAHPAAMSFFSQEREKIQGFVSVNVEYIPQLKQTIFRVPAGQTGAGQFMSKSVAAARIKSFLGK